MQSGDEATQALRKQLQEVQEVSDQFKQKAKAYYNRMESDLKSQHQQEIEQLKDKYERMINELKNNASSDKKFLQMEL